MELPFLSMFGLLTLGFAAANLIAPENQTAQAQDTDRRAPILAELFTSQSCSSCPQAEALFNELAETEGVVAIQWHVDYWDTLVHGRAGKWKDPYSRSAHTQRQRDYNYALRGKGSVYTPQAIIGGVSETTGSRTQAILQMISKAPDADVMIDIKREGSGYRVYVAPQPGTVTADAETMIVTLLRADATEIKAGENKGLSVSSRNVAVDTGMLGAWTGRDETYRADSMSEQYTCAVIVQEKGQGRILGASYCPED